ncbi:metal-dependent transcriptional regulator [Corynebacterium sp. CCUG 61414]|uniref:metal-dependent transcriptional regulator n=1 Tax=Corynebacterium TaxID=1716 RepID=UPI0009F4EA48|nr:MULTISPECIES: metal-dependent transcriptional regulator [unclassified Corynebacterium]MCQ4609308.1 metal-dependent transcriptional regulator [Corynebacterium sp. CCUG 61414]WPJ92599.1 metal-dependent transcriptional regulator [Corynebacterium sp. UMB2355A]
MDSVSQLSTSTQDYLKSLWALTEWSDTKVTTKVLADYMGLRLSSVSDAVKKLAQQGYVHHKPYAPITLTEEGRAHAVAMIRRHRLIETFLVETLGYSWDQVHDDAEVLEHAVSEFMLQRLDAHLNYPSRDPHGDPIPAADGTVPQFHAEPLSTIAPDNDVVVQRVSDGDPSLLQFFDTSGITVGTHLRTQQAAPFSDTVEVLIDGQQPPLALGKRAADAVWVTAESAESTGPTRRS